MNKEKKKILMSLIKILFYLPPLNNYYLNYLYWKKHGVKLE